MQKVLIYCLLCLISIPASAQQPCTGQAYIIDKDPKGTNVRAAPDGQAQVIHVIPFDEDGVIVTLTEFNNGWIRIRDYALIAQGPKKINGWVNARLLGTGGGRGTMSGSPHLYLEPQESSPRQKILPEEVGYRLLGCKGDWVHVEQIYPPHKPPTSGWLPGRSHCPNPVTTCS